jgi:hypothetical protein
MKTSEKNPAREQRSRESPQKSLAAMVFALCAAALFVAGLFLPAVDLVPWAPGANAFVLSFVGVVALGAGSIPHFIACLMGALANLAMLATFIRIVFGRKVSLRIPVAALVLAALVPVPLSRISPGTNVGMVSTGYYCWAAAALMLVAGGIFSRGSGKLKSESADVADQADEQIESYPKVNAAAQMRARGRGTRGSRLIVAATAAVLTLVVAGLITKVQARKLAYKKLEVRCVEEGQAVVDGYFREGAGSKLTNSFGNYLSLDGGGFSRPVWNIQGYHFLTLDRRAIFSNGSIPVSIHVVEARAAGVKADTVAIVSIQGNATSGQGLIMMVSHPQLVPPG